MITTTAAADMFDVISPATGRVVGTHPRGSADDIDDAVRRAREVAGWWGSLGFDERARRLDAWRGIIARRAPELAELTHLEMGKPRADAMLEIAMASEHLAWAAKNAARVLGRRPVRSSLLTANQSASVEYLPVGVVGVIGPWNYPIFTPLGSLSFALAAGNTVVYKPSEYTPGVGVWLAQALSEVVPEHPVLQVVTGDGSTGAALCRSGVDKIGFTGSTATGKQVMTACAETLTPVLMECGGKDALIVDADGDLDAAADAAVWGGFSNAGQTCLGVERVYVHEEVFDAFADRVVTRARTIRAGSGGNAQIGPITMPTHIDVIRRHIDDAIGRGGRAVLGGPDAIEGNLVQPTILVDVPEDSVAVTEETFGPTMTVTRVRDMDDAVDRTNASRYGLGLSIFSRRRGEEIATRIRTGAVSVNSYVMYAAVPSLPLGGVGDSGFGRVHGADGLREFTFARAMTRQRFPSILPLTTFRRTPRIDTLVRVLVRLLHGRH
ncbi:aldehyde dehydrogenase family protein [Rhodococcus opacus]|uniref:Aldehyde dehydrogenase n=1 Tax=Rhodococcus opacus TaxID=37919 RepID=A0AAX3YR86_RHOOP|nr:aldehyde dehydrogenase family protein [Rhodococcus opacus]MCZ4588599.1 aldehyde dehydrogenase family protein [Rhodococcus opacus]MDJ0419776.1 aldehyde dehydrogenase family protein [Rhodococcus opacus]MDV6247268.1 aldehyde dehydrogenase family protein [Rhodococcus opacus]WKN58974.1 aldehyde dehydrogenase family protein [Rhodococcus opacus]WLF50469.1 aldehyde dehydrogenase family protein [Rhodococcus opacus]